MSAQRPIGSGFGSRTTAIEALAGMSLAGKAAIVTGGYSGLGLATVQALAGAGAKVCVPARRPDAARTALAGLEGVEVAGLDLLDPVSIAAFAHAWGARPIDILIGNAAVMANPLTRDARGFESQFAANHLGHYALICGLWAGLLAARGARVVLLSSIGHRRSGVDFDDPHFERRAYDKWVAYGQSKSANALCAVGLDRRGADQGVRAFSVHPGGIMTALQRHLPLEEQIAMGWIDAEGRVNDLFKTVEQGAATSVWCAVSPQLVGKGGLYCEDCDVAALSAPGDPGWSGVRAHAVDPELAERLWALSRAATGLDLPG
jgi:NAD(P)-dependent dehydrogenase (short-subunit alcohol dehydrogenase family)